MFKTKSVQTVHAMWCGVGRDYRSMKSWIVLGLVRFGAVIQFDPLLYPVPEHEWIKKDDTLRVTRFHACSDRFVH